MGIKKSVMWTLACGILTAGVFAQQPGVLAVSPEAAARAAQLQSTEADPGAAIEALVARWQGPNAVLGPRWEAEFREIAAKRSAEELLAASEASTYKGAVDALLNGGRSPLLAGEKALGNGATDLVYFPVTPCRIVDTRTATGAYAGRIVAGAPRAFNHNFDLIAQTGGSVSSCGIPVDPAAIAVTVTSVSPLAAGNLIGYQTGLATPPNNSINNYAAITGLALANSTIIPTGQSVGTDFVIAVNGGSVHVIVDVVGYFWSPTSTPLQCVTTARASASVPAGGNANVSAPACAADYTEASLGCESSSWEMPMVYFSGGVCSARNNGASAATLRASRHCCRVPGR